MKILTVMMLLVVALTGTGCAGPVTSHLYPTELTRTGAWDGDFPAAHLSRFPDRQQDTATGYFGDAEVFNAVWLVYKPADPLPVIDFKKYIVIFVRNIRYYDPARIDRVFLKNGLASVVVPEIRSAIPVTDRVSLALAVVPRAGIRYIRVGQKGRIPVTSP